MEHGCTWEREAVRERWSELERRRRETSRLLGGLFAVLAGLVLLGVSLATSVCFTTMGGGVIQCTPATQPLVSAVLAVLGLLLVGRGLLTGWRLARA